MGDEQTSEVEDLERIFADTSAEPIQISYSTIKLITKNFCQVIGGGGFGVVYMGGLRNGMVAVKKILTMTDFSDENFLNEVNCLMKVKHRNIVRFLGYCADTQGELMEVEGEITIVDVKQRLICFEYVPNGNLHNYIQEKTHGHEWNVRYQIIKGICQGLHYMHQESIVHLDLKPANVLLGANMVPKITDFGSSRLHNEESRILTQHLIGTRGYLPPEFLYRGEITIKSDIFSLGVIMVNLITGTSGSINENWHETIDGIDVDSTQMKRCIEIAKCCVERDPHLRPSIGEIIHDLNETETMIENDPLITSEPRNDPTSSLYQIVLRFNAMSTLGEDSRTDTVHVELDVPECILEGCKKPGKLSFQLLRFITGNFSAERSIGIGGFGTIYRGNLLQKNVAVKRRHSHKTKDIDELMFYNEIKTMMLAQHKNVVRFLGYCSHTEEQVFEDQGNFIMADVQERLLCFEYLKKGSLDRYVFDLSWKNEWRERYQIIKGICEGLHYLHGKRILHLDLKPDNILLSDNMVPKIADFGISRYFGDNQSHTITENIIGSMGHMAPEFYDGVITFKTDIYSLGVTIAQIMTGRKYCSSTVDVLERWRKRLKLSSADTVLLGQIRVCAEISIACMHKNPEKRPDTRRIIDILVKTETADRTTLAVNDHGGPVALHNEVDTVSIELDVPECILEGSKKPGKLSYQLLRFITGNFSDERIVGQNEFADIFKGTIGLRDVAVKLYWSILIDDQRFHNEVKITLLTQHKNIVKCLGYCSHKEVEMFEVEGKFDKDEVQERLLCFEYLRNGRLAGYISDPSIGLEWGTRYKIIKEICEGLHYLHEQQIVHLDLRPATVVLDDNMVPKIADFCLSMFLGEKESRSTATSFFGTPGYMAPELLDTQVITLKSDIYSLGVTITEILIGRKHYSSIENVLERWKSRLLHTSSADTVLLEQVRVCAEISRACMAKDPDKRPDTGRIIEMLVETETYGTGVTISNNVHDTLYMELNVLECILDGIQKPGRLSRQLLQFITGNFSGHQEIGQGGGGFGITYRGNLRQRSVAVKSLSTNQDLEGRMFLNELNTMMLVQHKNIVQFLGYCGYTQHEAMEYMGKFIMAEMRERFLCYEYLRNGSLDRYVSDASCGLAWRTRYEIIKGICEGLHFLHKKHVVHLDLKPANIMLDENMVPKIAGFFLSMSLRENKSSTTATSISGTPGYLPPEYLYTGDITLKCDIYSLGVIITEILIGQKDYSAIEDVLESWENSLLRTSLADTELLEQVRVCAEISRACIAADPDKRPDTGRIIEMLLEIETYGGGTISNNVDDGFHVELDALECIIEGSKKPGRLSDQLLLFITGNFSGQQEIGQGASGITYRGILRQRSVAVKRLSTTTGFDDRMFCSEIKTMMLVKHKNIVQFLGYCRYTEHEAVEQEGKFVMAGKHEKLLCFEYLSNGSLDRYVSDPSTGFEWRERYEMIKGICQGIHYLHGMHIVHLDLRPANILLDDNMVPKIADFCLSRCFVEDQSQIITRNNFNGKLQYMAPELIDGVITFKSDIYSLGVIITEILQGDKGYLEIEKVLESWRNRLGTSSTEAILIQVRVCAEISMACTDRERAKRPDIQDIIGKLVETELWKD